jgi:hypothetical protein
MGAFLTALPLILNIACAASLIRPDEAKVLAIHAARASGVPIRFNLDAEEDGGQTSDTLTFRVFATNNPDDDTGYNLAGWFTVNVKTADLSDPVFDDKPISIPALRAEQRRLRAEHCQP